MRYLYSNLHSFNLINGERLTEITDIQIPLDDIMLGSVFFLQRECFEKKINHHNKEGTRELQPSGGLQSKREVPRGVRNSKVRRQDKFRRDWSRH